MNAPTKALITRIEDTLKLATSLAHDLESQSDLALRPVRRALENVQYELDHVIDGVRAGAEFETPEHQIARDQCPSCKKDGALIRHWMSGCDESKGMPGWIKARRLADGR